MRKLTHRVYLFLLAKVVHDCENEKIHESCNISVSDLEMVIAPSDIESDRVGKGEESMFV